MKSKTKLINSDLSLALAALLLVSAFILPLTACGKKDSSPYADVKKAIEDLGDDNYFDYGACYITFVDNQSDCGEPAVEFDFDGKDSNTVTSLCGAFIEKTKGMELPLIYINIRDDTLEKNKRTEQVFSELKGLQCKSAGLYWNWDYDSIPDFVTRLVTEEPAYHQSYPAENSVKELYDRGFKDDALYLNSFPKLESLKFSGTSEPGNIPELPSLKSIEFDDVNIEARKLCFAETAFALYQKNPNIETINGTPAESYNWTEGFEPEELIEFNADIQAGNVTDIDLSDFTEISFDEAKLHGKIAVSGYGKADSLSNFTAPDQYVSSELKSSFTDDPLKRDTVIKITTEFDEDTVVYTNGASGQGFRVFLTVIDPVNKTITDEKQIAHVTPPSTVDRLGTYHGEISEEDTWKEINELFAEKYE